MRATAEDCLCFNSHLFKQVTEVVDLCTNSVSFSFKSQRTCWCYVKTQKIDLSLNPLGSETNVFALKREP